MFDTDRLRVAALGRPAGSALRLHQYMQGQPLVTTTHAAQDLTMSLPTVAASLKHLEGLGIVRELTGKARGRDSPTTGTSPS